MHTEHYKDDSGDNDVLVADEGDITCVCDNIVSKDNAIECDTCHVKHCKDCIKPDYEGTGLNTCDTCIEDGALVRNLRDQIYQLDWDKKECLKTIDKILEHIEEVDVPKTDVWIRLGRIVGGVKMFCDITKAVIK